MCSVLCGLCCVTDSLNYFSLRRNFWFSPSNYNICFPEVVGGWEWGVVHSRKYEVALVSSRL